MAELKDWIAVFGNPEIINYFPAEGKKGESMKRAKITNMKEPKTCQNGAIQYSFELMYFDEEGDSDGTKKWRNAFIGENTPADFADAIKSLKVGDIAGFGFSPSESGGRKYWNITTVMPEKDINADITTPPPSQQKSAPAKNDIKKDKFDPDLSKKQTCLNGAVQMVVAWINAGQKMGTEDVEKTYDLLMGIIEK